MSSDVAFVRIHSQLTSLRSVTLVLKTCKCYQYRAKYYALIVVIAQDNSSKVSRVLQNTNQPHYTTQQLFYSHCAKEVMYSPVSASRGALQIQDRSRQNASVIGCATRPVLTVATGLGFATRPWCLFVFL